LLNGWVADAPNVLSKWFLINLMIGLLVWMGGAISSDISMTYMENLS